MKGTFNILMVGVGGQGIILASDIVSRAALASGYDVKKSEVHGMSQRGGSVFSHIRFGKKVYSPLIGFGEADLLVSLEEMETLRWIEYARPGGTVIAAKTRILPAGITVYPEGIEQALKKQFKDTIMVDAADIIARTGHARYMNVALVGMVSRFVGIKEAVWNSILEASVPRGTFEQNQKAFDIGKSYREKADNHAME